MNSLNEKNRGFTLVEMSIVLVIIGLIIGGILVGQDLINNARISATVAQIQKYDTAYNTFRGKYNGIPGDLVKAAAFLGEDDGDGDGSVDDADDDDSQDAFTGEVGEAFVQLSVAGMVDGAFTEDSAVAGTGYPLTKLKKSGITLGANATGVNYWLIGTSTGVGSTNALGINRAEAYGIDFKLDDGQPNTGNVLPSTDLSTAGAAGQVTSGACDDGTDYTLTADTNDCMLSVKVSG